MKTLTDYILIRPDDKETKTKSGLYLPENAQNKSTIAVVKGVGNLIPETVLKVGDKIIFKKWAGSEYKHDNGETWFFLKLDDIMAVID